MTSSFQNVAVAYNQNNILLHLACGPFSGFFSDQLPEFSCNVSVSQSQNQKPENAFLVRAKKKQNRLGLGWRVTTTRGGPGAPPPPPAIFNSSDNLYFIRARWVEEACLDVWEGTEGRGLTLFVGRIFVAPHNLLKETSTYCTRRK